ncbi:MAG: ATP-binding protein [Acidobacteriota bacterium]
MEQKKRINRIIITLLLLLFLLLIFIQIFIMKSKELSIEILSNMALNFFLFNIIIILILTLLFVLGRNLLKLYTERKNKILGSHFKTNLVIFFIGFSIIPTLLLFIFASDLINKNIESWFKTPIDEVIKNSQSIAEAYYSKIEENAQIFSVAMSEEIEKKYLYLLQNRDLLQDYFKERMFKYKLDFLTVLINGDEFTLINPALPLEDYKEIPPLMIEKAFSEGYLKKIDPMGKGEIVRYGTVSSFGSSVKMLTIIGKFIPESHFRNLRRISADLQKYQQIKIYKDPMKTTYFLLLLFITLLLIFAASWLGFHLAKGITLPIEKLASATKEVSAGNLDVKVEHPATGELQILINSFNNMINELKENQIYIAQKTDELEKRTKFIETILNNVSTGVITLDSNGMITTANPSSLKILNLNEDNVLGKSYTQIFNLPQYLDIKNTIEKAFKSKFKITEREIGLDLDGTSISLTLNLTPLKDTGNKFLGMIMVLDDLTQLIRAQKMVAWREVAQRVAHEIKNPLTPIQLSAERILKNIDKSNREYKKIVEEGVSTIMKEIDSIKKLSTEFSKFARMPVLQSKPSSIHKVIDEIVDMFKEMFPEVNFQVNFAYNVPERVTFDPDQMKRALINVLDNAVEAMEKRGDITISISYNEDLQYIKIEIVDTGPGIPPSEKHKLFTPYFSTKKRGRGLGLAIVNEIISEHNGYISVEDNSPRGTKFIIELPV